ncbi:MAG: penicillin-binding protein 1C [Candidatus Eremiobacteraeota bacterium]|nr:penicillin-binding protein 1C [Candidatus Eremiobacteraeota bacterium]
MRAGKRRKATRGVLIFLCVLLAAYLAIPLPGDELFPGTAASAELLDRQGKVLRTVLSDEEGTSCWKSLDEISPYLLQATVAAEDRRFYRHCGVDPRAVARALVQNLQARRIVSGASTITQQVAGITYHLPQGRVVSKLREMIYALKIEGRLNKKAILEVYLNRVPYGNQLYGAEAASEAYFEKPARDLSPAQAAFLAAIPQAPSLFDPYRNFGRVLARQREILGLMRQEGFIGEKELMGALNEPLKVAPRDLSYRAPHFCDYVIATLKSQGIRPSGAVTTTLDGYLQEKVEVLLRERVRALRDQGVSNGAVVVLDNRTWEVLAMAGSVDFWGPDGQVNAALALRQPGSTLKPFTYAIALETGLKASDIIPDLRISIPTESGDFTPLNYDNTFHGPVRMRTALACSYNVPAVRTLQHVGKEFLCKRLRAAGFTSLIRDPRFYGLGLTLGSGEITLLELARGYAMFACGGETFPLHVVRKVKDARGGAVALPLDTAPLRVFSPQASFIVTDILDDDEARVPAFGRYSPLSLPFHCAAKTGTSKNFRDNWTVGYTPLYTVAVWVGNFDNTPMKKVSGITGAGPLFYDVMMTVMKGKACEDFPMPPGMAEMAICPQSGMLPGDFCPDSMKEYFMEGHVPRTRCDVHRMVKIDRRTGAAASPDCPRHYVHEKVYEVYPPLYATWMAEHHISPPPEAMAASPESRKESLAVVFPRDGDLFRIDPILRREYQVLHFKAMVPESVKEITWWLDGKPLGLAKYPFVYEWPLRDGVHTLAIGPGRVPPKEKVTFSVY